MREREKCEKREPQHLYEPPNRGARRVWERWYWWDFSDQENNQDTIVITRIISIVTGQRRIARCGEFFAPASNLLTPLVPREPPDRPNQQNQKSVFPPSRNLLGHSRGSSQQKRKKKREKSKNESFPSVKKWKKNAKENEKTESSSHIRLGVSLLRKQKVTARLRVPGQSRASPRTSEERPRDEASGTCSWTFPERARRCSADARVPLRLTWSRFSPVAAHRRVAFFRITN